MRQLKNTTWSDPFGLPLPLPPSFLQWPGQLPFHLSAFPLDAGLTKGSSLKALGKTENEGLCWLCVLVHVYECAQMSVQGKNGFSLSLVFFRKGLM